MSRLPGKRARPVLRGPGRGNAPRLPDWKPFYSLLAEAGLPVMLVNASQVRQIPGRKTDVADAVWLADLAAHGLVRGSFVPDLEITEAQGPGPGADDPGPAAR